MSSSLKPESTSMESLGYSRVTIVDDDLIVLKLLAQQLKSFGVPECQLFNTGREILESLKTTPTDLIIFDLKLPDIDGPQLMRAFADLGYQGSLLIITGSDSRILHTLELLSEELGLRLIGAMTKPVNPYELEWLMQSSPTITASDDDARNIRPQRIIDDAMIQAGLSRGAVLPFYQPKWDLTKSEICGFEVLARWQHEDGSILGPGAFIPFIERSGQLDIFTTQLLDLVLRDSAALLDINPKLNFSVNFGITSLQDRHLPDRLMARLDAHGLTPQQLTLEVTERGLAENAPNVLEVMARLRLMGFQLSIDDFGTGFSSFSRAKGLPFTELKIDRAFVMDADSNQSSRAVIRSSVALAKDLCMQVVAEGVESEQIMKLMSDKGCTMVQGFYVAKPQPLDDTLALLKGDLRQKTLLRVV